MQAFACYGLIPAKAPVVVVSTLTLALLLFLLGNRPRRLASAMTK
jgi:hypothetical protein